MNNPPLYDYTSKMDIPLYRKANWIAFHKIVARRYGLAILILLPVFMILFAAVESRIHTGASTTEILSKVALMSLVCIGFTFLLAYTSLAINSALSIKKVCDSIGDLPFHTTLTETDITIRNPMNGTVKTYPYKVFTIFVNHPDFFMLKAEHELIFVGKANLKANNALDFFTTSVASGATK